MTLKRDPSRCIGDVIRSNRRMMRDLLDNKCRQPTCVGVWPITVEKSARRKAGLRYVIRSIRDLMTYSPSTGFRGLPIIRQRPISVEGGSRTHFFSEPIVSFREVYWPLSVLMNHLRTRRARSSGVLPWATSAKSSGRSHQYAIGQRTGYGEHKAERCSGEIWVHREIP